MDRLLEEMGEFLEIESSKIESRRIKNMNRPITSNEIKSARKQLPRNRSWGPNGLMGEFYQIFKEEFTSVLKLFQKFE